MLLFSSNLCENYRAAILYNFVWSGMGTSAEWFQEGLLRLEFDRLIFRSDTFRFQIDVQRRHGTFQLDAKDVGGISLRRFNRINPMFHFLRMKR